MDSNETFGEDPARDENAEEYRAQDQSPARSAETGTTYDSTGEPESTPHDEVLAAEAGETHNPNAASSAGLAGDLGLSSERTGPADETGDDGLGDIQGTGTVGSARSRTHGTVPTTGGPMLEDAPGRDAADLPPVEGDEAKVHRTVGESNTAEVPPHEVGHKNPGHSGA